MNISRFIRRMKGRYTVSEDHDKPSGRAEVGKSILPGGLSPRERPDGGRHQEAMMLQKHVNIQTLKNIKYMPWSNLEKLKASARYARRRDTGILVES